VVDILSGEPTPEYQLPYEAEFGADLDIEKMKNAIICENVRPVIPDVWDDLNNAVFTADRL